MRPVAASRWLVWVGLLALGLAGSAPAQAATPTPTSAPRRTTSTPAARTAPTRPTPTPVRGATPTAAPSVSPIPTAAPIPTASPTPPPPPTPSVLPGTEVIGYSREGRPLLAFRVGSGRRTVLLVGGIHAGTEVNAAALVQQMLDQAQTTPDVWSADVALEILPLANPDGYADGTRELASGVDANRNWPTADWAPDTYEAGPYGPLMLAGGGGPSPLSEPETAALASFVLRLHPAAVVSYHSAASLVMGGPAAHARGLDEAYAQATGYRVGDWAAYPVTGDFAQWAEDQGIPTVEIELPDHRSTDFEANWNGLLNLLWAGFA